MRQPQCEVNSCVAILMSNGPTSKKVIFFPALTIYNPIPHFLVSIVPSLPLFLIYRVANPTLSQTLNECINYHFAEIFFSVVVSKLLVTYVYTLKIDVGHIRKKVLVEIKPSNSGLGP